MEKGAPKKRLYLDVCTLCRPFDDQSAMRIQLETNAFYLMMQNIEDGRYEMVISPVHAAEVRAIEDTKERLELTAVLQRFQSSRSWTLSEIRRRAEQLHSWKFGPADAAHVAFAEAGADYFVSCDDRLLKKCRSRQVKVIALNPVEFCIREDLR
jgi:predicted nucleic acid-binding protein